MMTEFLVGPGIFNRVTDIVQGLQEHQERSRLYKARLKLAMVEAVAGERQDKLVKIISVFTIEEQCLP